MLFGLKNTPSFVEKKPPPSLEEPPLEANPSKEETTLKTHKLPKGLVLNTLKETPKERYYSEEEIAISLPIKGDKAYKEVLLTHSFVKELEELFPAVDVQCCLRKMYAWLCSNEKRQKTKQGLKKFITTWLSKEQDSATKRRAGFYKPKEDIPAQKGQDEFYEWKKRLGVPTHLNLTANQLQTLEKLSPAGRRTMIASLLNLQEDQIGGENVELH